MIFYPQGIPVTQWQKARPAASPKPEKISWFEHKGAHALLGAVLGAVQSPRDMGKGALSGAIGGALGEVIAEQLTPNMAASFDEKLAEKKAELGRDLTHAEAKEEHEEFLEEVQSSIEFKARIGTAFAAALLKQDVHITDSTAENAIKNNWLNFVISAGMIVWSGYEAFETYKKLVAEGKTEEEAQRTAVQQFGKEALISLVGGAIAGRILKALKAPGSKVLDMLIAESPVLQKIATRAGVALESVSTKAKAATDFAKNTAQKAKDTAKDMFGKRAAKAEASAAGKGSSSNAWKEAAKQAEKDADRVFSSKSVGAAKCWTSKARLKSAKLPIEGRVRFVPPKGYNAANKLPKNQGGYEDKFGNIWKRGPSRTTGEAFEWDVQLSRMGKEKFGWASRDGAHLNVSLFGKITH